MKTLTVRQPWASLIAAGLKDVENRTWRTNYRGLLAIHAGSGTDRHALDTYGHLLDNPDQLPHGAIIAVATLTDCVQDHESPWAIPGQWHWLLADPRPLRPFHAKGRLGLWEIPPKGFSTWRRRRPIFDTDP